MSESRTEERYLWLQRLLEMVPGTVSWAVIVGPIWLSFSYPWLVAYFVLTFDFYWLCRALWFAGSVIVAYRRMRDVLATDWRGRLRSLDDPELPDWRSYTHLALIPTYTEALETLRHTVRALAEADWPADHKICAIITRETDAAGIANVEALRARVRGRLRRVPAHPRPAGAGDRGREEQRHGLRRPMAVSAPGARARDGPAACCW